MPIKPSPQDQPILAVALKESVSHMSSFSRLLNVISTKFLEEGLGAATTDIQLVINTSFTFGSFPSCFKYAAVQGPLEDT